jgi:hypothetical protein
MKRGLRLQFSLRALLLLVTLVGLGLTYYRWPWEETGVLSDQETKTTTYRRAWNGRRVKHGRQFIVGKNQRLVHEVVYHDDERRFDRQYHPSGELDCETAYPPPGNVAHVRRFKTIGSETVVCEQRIALDAARISNTWRTNDGVQLQSADYVAGVLTHWNDQPIELAIERVLADVRDPAIRAGWLAECHPDSTEIIEDLGDNIFRETCWLGRYVKADGQVVSPGAVHSRVILRVLGCNQLTTREVQFFFSQSDGYFLGASGQTVTKAHFQSLLKRLLAADYTLVVRQGVVCAVPINAEQLSPR